LKQSKAPKSKSRNLDVAITFLAFLILKVLYMTLRKRFIHEDRINAYFRQDKPFILTFWHNRTMLGHLAYSQHKPAGRNLCVTISQSRDGELACKVLKRLGLDFVRGSSSSHGLKALYDLVKKNKHGYDLAFAPDGPHGPIYKVKHGVLGAAKITGSDILPISSLAEKKIRLKSWDRMIVPLPFSKVYFIYGTPLQVPKDCTDQDLDIAANTLEKELNRLEEEITSITGVQK